jgi:hypothetical protein
LSLLAALAYCDAREAALRGAELLKKGLDTDERPGIVRRKNFATGGGNPRSIRTMEKQSRDKHEPHRIRHGATLESPPSWTHRHRGGSPSF